MHAQLNEARSDPESAAVLYASAEERLRAFSLPERAQALLGQGRCLLALGDPLAEPTLRGARMAFLSLDARRFVPEADRLIERAVALTS